MEHRFVRYYEAELRYIRELGAEFGRRFPKVAARLGLSELASDDPHVERLLQAFAFTAGRAHMALDAEFPALTQPLVDLLNRNFLAPTPSMAVVQFSVAAQSSGLGTGFTIPRETLLETRTGLGAGRGTRCEFRTGHAVRLLPISLERATYTSVLRDIEGLRVPTREPIRALLKLKLRCHNMSFSRLDLRSLPIFISGRDDVGARLYEQLITSASAIVMRWGPDNTQHVSVGTEPRPIKACGFDPEHALLPRVAAEFEPYRLLQEYFACPARFDFVELTGLAAGMSRCLGEELDLTIALTRFDPSLEHAVDVERLALFATPVVNLFPRDCGRITVLGNAELRIEPDAMRPLDIEVHSVTRVATRTDAREHGVELQPAYLGQPDHDNAEQPRYVLRRQANPLPERLSGARSRYLGSELFVRLIEAHSPPQTRQIHVHTLCTNRDLPLSLTLGHSPPGSRDFDIRSGVPADGVRCIVAPTAPAAAPTEGSDMWRFLSHMSLNYLGLHRQTGGVDALRDLLDLYARLGAPPLRRQVDGFRNIASRPVIGPYPEPGPRQFIRGLEVELECDEHAFGGHGAFVLAAVLARLFAKQASTNSFAQTRLTTPTRGEIFTFPALPGLRRTM
jgi:type VI secretion system protein ImpG